MLKDIKQSEIDKIQRSIQLAEASASGKSTCLEVSVAAGENEEVRQIEHIMDTFEKDTPAFVIGIRHNRTEGQTVWWEYNLVIHSYTPAIPALRRLMDMLKQQGITASGVVRSLNWSK